MEIRDILNEQMGLCEEHTNCVIEDGIGIGGPTFQRHRKTFIDGINGAVTVETMTLHRLDCGHIVGSKGSQELLANCQICGKSICFRCGARCSKCAVFLCPSCTKTIESDVYCAKCKRITVWKQRGLSLLGRIHDGLKE